MPNASLPLTSHRALPVAEALATKTKAMIVMQESLEPAETDQVGMLATVKATSKGVAAGQEGHLIRERRWEAR